MDRAPLIASTLPKDISSVKIVEREWGIERCFKSKDGKEHCVPAAFDTWLFGS